MSSKSNYLEQKMVEHVLPPRTAFSPTGSVWVALVTTPPNDAGADYVEVADANGYARLEIDGTTRTFGAVEDGDNAGKRRTNGEKWSWTASGGNWGEIVGAMIMDSGTHSTGNMLYYVPFDASQVVNDGNILSINAGQLKIEEA